MSKINRVGNYADYIRNKALSTRDNSLTVNYNKSYNKAIDLKNNGQTTEAIKLLKNLYSVKKSPDVQALLIELGASCS